ncbi:MAG TPA: beta-galactosidase [Candidatus Aminicenantes bacterium]|nr:beta-galactosidase [Candidatus Aminicenantes bacterium]
MIESINEARRKAFLKASLSKLRRKRKMIKKSRSLYWLGVLFVILISSSCHPRQETLPWKPAAGPLFTPWAERVSPSTVWNVYPRPQQKRKEWLNLNGLWDVAILPVDEGPPQEFQGKILVPFPVEAALSGIAQKVTEKQKVWYRRFFSLPAHWRGKKIFLNFEASDWETSVWVNGQLVGTHRGGYDPFQFDISPAVKEGKQELLVAVWDPTDKGYQPRGKQVQNPQGIWYTAVTGIWGTVWLEPVSQVFIDSLQITPDVDRKEVKLQLGISSLQPELVVKAMVLAGEALVAEREVLPGEELVIPIENPRLWSPEDPFLYQLQIVVEREGEVVDEVESYFGLRKISLGKDGAGRTRIFLNNRPYFQLGTLDQGFWPDGIYTAPSEKAWIYDLNCLRSLGFNLLRKHVKVEPRRYYYWCDRLGVLIWQDMPSGDKYIGRNQADLARSKESVEQFKLELERIITNLRNHPSVVVWVLFNEGWGQFETEALTEWVKKMDPTRLVDSASGWVDRGVGDLKDIHAYPGPAMPPLEADRAVVLGEFGGLGLPVPFHTWQQDKSWGYRNFASFQELTQAYVDLIKKLKDYVHRGLSAAVYTQTSDVEIEVNGLLTYDRVQLKVLRDKVAPFNLELRSLGN